MADISQPAIIDPATVNQEISDSLQAYVDQEQKKRQSLYDQREALKAQILTLNQQLNVLNKQIAEGESTDLIKARRKLQALEMIDAGRMRPGLPL